MTTDETNTTPSLPELESLQAAASKPKSHKPDFSGFGNFLREMFFGYRVARNQKKDTTPSRKQLAHFNAARNAFNRRSRHAAHRRAVLQGYQAKADLVKRGKGRNSLAGVPAAYRTEVEK